MKLTGDFAKLAKFKQQCASTPEVYKSLSRRFAEDAIALTRAGFRKATDPYGAGWEGTIRGGRILRDSGGMYGSIARVSSVNRFTISVGKEYASTHQHGATISAKRTKRVEFTRRNPRRRNAKGKLRRRKTGFGGYHNVVMFRKALCFQIGGKWVQKQTVKIPRRMMVPSRARGVPRKWSDKFQRTTDKTFRRHFR